MIAARRHIKKSKKTTAEWRRGFQQGHRDGYAEALKECGGCRFCYGKGYSTRIYGSRMQVSPCVCERGKQFDDVTLRIQNRQACVKVK